MLVISDVFMPDGNGIEALSEIKLIRPSLPVIIISAQNSILTAVEATQATAFDYLSKPFDLIDLLRRVSKALIPKNSKNYIGDTEVSVMDKDLPLVGKSTEMQSLYKLIAKLINGLIFIYSIWYFLVFMNKVENWVTLHQYCPTQPQRLSLQIAQKLNSAAPRIRLTV